MILFSSENGRTHISRKNEELTDNQTDNTWKILSGTVGGFSFILSVSIHRKDFLLMYNNNNEMTSILLNSTTQIVY